MEKYAEEVAILIAQTGPLNGQRWAVDKELTIGRERYCDIVIADRQVSRHHARFSPSPQGVILEDLGSKNGTHHNGTLLSGQVVLQDGDIIQIALAQKFVFLSSDATVPLELEEAESLFKPQESQQPEEHRLVVDSRSRRVWIKLGDGDQITEHEVLPPLSASQYRLLETLYKNPGEVVSRHDLVTAVWGEEESYNVSEQALDALVRRLRDRLTQVDNEHTYIVTVRGHGLRLDNPKL